MTSKHSRKSRIARILGATTGALLLAGLASAGAFYWLFVVDLPDIERVEDYRPALASHVFDRSGRSIGIYFTERRELTRYEDVPEHVIQAFVAGEDNTFFEHEGIDFQAILRAALVNLRAGGEKVQGASTITQQMVKGLLLTPERTYRRKIREMILARRIEQRLTKQEILYLYLNQIYFGHGAYGIGEAARTYFDKAVPDLDVSEAALLAGLPKAPSAYSPFRNPERAEERRQYVLVRMRDEGFIEPEAWEIAAAEPPPLRETQRREDFEAAATFTEEVRRWLFESLGGERVLGGGLRVETTLDIDMQRAAVDAVKVGIEDLDRRQGYRGALRQVEEDAIEHEIVRVGEENGLLEPPPEEEVLAGDIIPSEEDAEPAQPAEADTDTDTETQPTLVAEQAPASDDPLARARTRLEEDGPALGVVVAVSRKQGQARVALAPGVEGLVRVEDVGWARKADSSGPGQLVERIDRVFAVGDVARFVLRRPDVPPADADAAPVEDDSELLQLSLFQQPIAQGALLSVDVASGDVLAMVGGYDFDQSEFNRVTQARRQPGSAFKPLIYGAALSLEDDEGRHVWTPASIVHDRATVYEDRASGFVWKPKNYDGKFKGPITLRKALAKSANNAALQLAKEIGIGEVMDYARRLGVESPLERSLALALGSSDVSLYELTRAYAVFPSGGRRVIPHYIRRVLDRDGNVLIENVALGAPPQHVPDPSEQEDDEAVESVEEEEAIEIAEAPPSLSEDTGEAEQPADPDQLIPPEDAYLMADMLRAVVLEGTGWRLKQLGRPLGGKTGTTNDQADAWFIGFSPSIVTGVWVGHDESRVLGFGETGSRAAAPIWVDYMRVALAKSPYRDFSAPDSIVFTRIDKQTGLLAASGSADTLFQPFIAGTEPTETADTRRTTEDARRDLRQDSFTPGGALQLMQLDSF
jgi:penicillin-binding protein 1A